jgi:hypothetical protein
MATNFKSFPQHVPTDGQLCAIRVFNVESTACIGTWRAATEDFLVGDFSVPVPWWAVVQWRHQNAP